MTRWAALTMRRRRGPKKREGGGEGGRAACSPYSNNLSSGSIQTALPHPPFNNTYRHALLQRHGCVRKLGDAYDAGLAYVWK